MSEFWDKNQKWIVAAAAAILFIAAGFIAASFPYPAGNVGDASKKTAVNKGALPEAAAPEAGASAYADAADTADEDLRGELVLYITGAVRRPGVYQLPAESRLLRLVQAAGGLSGSADHTAVNLAALLEDGMHIHVPAQGEASPIQTAYTGVTADAAPSAIESANSGLPKIGLPKTGLPKTGLPVDVNKATAEELTALNGIGPALAARIVDYRLKNGRFASVDELLHVKGIGRKTLEKFRDAAVALP